MNSIRRAKDVRFAPTARLIFAVATALLALVPATAASADPLNPVYVPESSIQPISASSGWAVDYGSAAGTYSVAVAPNDTETSLKLAVASAAQQMTVQKRFGQVVDMPLSVASDNFASLRALLADASFTFQGDNAVNYQINVLYRPTDEAQFGVNGTTPCASAGFDGWCYTTMKYQPVTYTAGSFTTYDVSQTFDDGFVGGSQSGWWRSQRVGTYPKPGNTDDVSLNDMLTQVSELRVASFGVSLGSGAPSATTYVRDLTFGGTTYRFGDPVVVVDAPIASLPVIAGSALVLLGGASIVSSALQRRRQRLGAMH